jgi:hypothetical protein
MLSLAFQMSALREIALDCP